MYSHHLLNISLVKVSGHLQSHFTVRKKMEQSRYFKKVSQEIIFQEANTGPFFEQFAIGRTCNPEKLMHCSRSSFLLSSLALLASIIPCKLKRKQLRIYKGESLDTPHQHHLGIMCMHWDTGDRGEGHSKGLSLPFFW